MKQSGIVLIERAAMSPLDFAHVLGVWCLVVIAVEAITEIIVASDLFFNIRDKLSTKFPESIGKLVNCGYCASVWISMGAAFIAPGTLTKYMVVDIIIKIFAIHRLSNVFHEFMKRWLDRIPKTFIVHKTGVSTTEQVINEEGS